MTEQLTLEDVTSVVLDCHGAEYDSGLPPTAYNKILFLIQKDLKGNPGVNVDIPYFWYMFGPVVSVTGSNVEKAQTREGERIRCEKDTDNIHAGNHAVKKVRESAENALTTYYEDRTGGLIAEAYQYAPYEVGQVFRELKQRLETQTNSDQTSLADFGGDNRSEIRNLVHDFVKEFPVTEFPEFEDELHIWYRLVSAELDSDDYDPEDVEDLTKEFWRMFCLELACRENNGLTREEIESELESVSESIPAEKNNHRDSLAAKERNKAEENATGGKLALKASEAVIVPHLDFDAGL